MPTFVLMFIDISCLVLTVTLMGELLLSFDISFIPSEILVHRLPFVRPRYGVPAVNKTDEGPRLKDLTSQERSPSYETTICVMSESKSKGMPVVGVHLCWEGGVGRGTDRFLEEVFRGRNPRSWGSQGSHVSFRRVPAAYCRTQPAGITEKAWGQFRATYWCPGGLGWVWSRVWSWSDVRDQ